MHGAVLRLIGLEIIILTADINCISVNGYYDQLLEDINATPHKEAVEKIRKKW